MLHQSIKCMHADPLGPVILILNLLKVLHTGILEKDVREHLLKLLGLLVVQYASLATKKSTKPTKMRKITSTKNPTQNENQT